MKTLLFSVSLLFLNPLWAGADPLPPKRAVWDRWISERTAELTREQRIQLATYFPKFFGFRFVCLFKDSGGNGSGTPVLPGESLDAPNGGSLYCPDGYEIALEKQTKIKVNQVDTAPRITVEKGHAEISFGASPVFVETSGFLMGAMGAGTQQKLSVGAADGTQNLECTYGDLSADLESKEGSPPKMYLTSQGCRMEIVFNRAALKRYVWSGDKVQIENLVVPRRFWPNVVVPAGTLPPRVEGVVMVLSSRPSADPKGPLKVFWNMTGSTPGASCKVLVQKSDTDALVEMSKFETKELSGEVSVDHAYLDGYLSLLCEQGKTTFASNAEILKVGVPLPPGVNNPPTVVPPGAAPPPPAKK